MQLPFTSDQFFGIFADYNRAFGGVAVALWLVSVWMLLAAWRNPEQRSRRLTYFLGLLWAWNAVAYHAWLFTRINPAAWFFAGLFALQAVLLFRHARVSADHFSSARPRLSLGTGLVMYALAYPLLSMAAGHAYPATPTFGVPCPTAIMTIGWLFTLRGAIPVRLAIIPALWGLVGGSAAVLLDVPTDFVLLGAGVLLCAALAGQWARRQAAR